MEFKNLKEERLKHEYKQELVAKILGITQQQYYLYESGKRDIPVEYLIKLAIEYETTIDYLVGIENRNQIQDPNKIKYKKIINAYKNNPKLQYAVDKLLDI